jgi:hypothetical protein
VKATGSDVHFDCAVTVLLCIDSEGASCLDLKLAPDMNSCRVRAM